MYSPDPKGPRKGSRKMKPSHQQKKLAERGGGGGERERERERESEKRERLTQFSYFHFFLDGTLALIHQGV